MLLSVVEEHTIQNLIWISKKKKNIWNFNIIKTINDVEILQQDLILTVTINHIINQWEHIHWNSGKTTRLIKISKKCVDLIFIVFQLSV